jgi:hypothetical protein
MENLTKALSNRFAPTWNPPSNMDQKTALMGELIFRANRRRDALTLETDLIADRAQWSQGVCKRLAEVFGDGDVLLRFDNPDSAGALQYLGESDALTSVKQMYEADIHRFREIRSELERR